MAIVTFSSVLKGSDNVVTLDKAELSADTKVIADPYFSNQANWSKVAVTYKTTSGQLKNIFFDALLTTPTGNFDPSIYAMTDWLVNALVVYGVNDEILILTRSDLNTVNFDITLTEPPVILPPANVGYVGEPFTWDINVAVSQFPSGNIGSAIDSYAIVSGSLPTGVSLNPTTGEISGTPTVAQGATFVTIGASNSAGEQHIVFEITVIAVVVSNALTWNEFGNDFITTSNAYIHDEDGALYYLIQSNEQISSGSFELKFKTTPVINQQVVGLDISPHASTNNDYNLIDYGFSFSGGSWSIWQNGGVGGSPTGAFSDNDEFKIEVDTVADEVRYYKVNMVTPVHTTSIAMVFPVKLTSTAYSTTPRSMTLYDITFGDYGDTGQTWTTEVSDNTSPTMTILQAGTTIQKSGGTNYSGDNNSRTINEIISGDGFVQVTVPAGYASGGNRGRFGLQHSAPLTDPTSATAPIVMDYQLYIRGTALRVHEASGSIAQHTSVADGDVIRIEISGTDVIYSKNGTTFRTVPSATLNYPYGAGVVVETTAAPLSGIEFSGTS